MGQRFAGCLGESIVPFSNSNIGMGAPLLRVADPIDDYNCDDAVDGPLLTSLKGLSMADMCSSAVGAALLGGENGANGTNPAVCAASGVASAAIA